MIIIRFVGDMSRLCADELRKTWFGLEAPSDYDVSLHNDMATSAFLTT